MSVWQIVIVVAYGALVLSAALRHIILSLAIKKMRFLQPSGPRLPASECPMVSILVPAKDEAHGIERCVRALLTQDYPSFEIIVVDDRSADATASIVERLTREDSRVRLVRVENLPPGWTGKTHALHLGQRQARGEWLLFVDADTFLDPSCLAVTLRDAVDHEVELESLLPALEASSFWEKTVQPFAGVCLMVLYPLTKVNRPQHASMGFANGQFILITRAAYDAIGGHEGVRDKFVEDIHIGRRVREAGRGLRVVMGRNVARVRMYSTLRDIIRGWSRILYSAVDFRPGKLYALIAATVVYSVLSYAVLAGFGVALLLGARSPFNWTMFGLGAAHQLLQMTIMARIYALSKSDLRYLVVRVLAVAVMLYVFVRTIWMCRTHRVTWRGTDYDKAIQSPTAPVA